MTVSRFPSQAGTRARSRVLVHDPQCGTNAPTGLYLHTPCRFRAAVARASCASGLAQIGQFRRPQLRAAIARSWHW